MVFLKKPIVLAVIAVLALLILVPWAMSGDIFDDLGFTTDGKEEKHQGIWFQTQFNLVDYAGSWLPNKDSQPMTITGAMKGTNEWTHGGSVDSFRYILYVEGDESQNRKYPTDGSWKHSGAEPVTGSWVYFEPWTTSVKAEGTVRLVAVMELIVKDAWGFKHTYILGEDGLPWDGAYLRSGSFDMYLPANNQGPFETGENVKIYVDTGYDTDNSWAVKVYPPFDRTDIDQTGVVIGTFHNDQHSYASWTVPANAYKVGSINQWRAELWNTYFNEKVVILLTIDMHERAPIISSVVATENTNSMTYKVTTNQTYKPVRDIMVYAYYGESTGQPPAEDVQSWILNGITYPVVGNVATFTVSCKAGIDGQVVIMIIAYDTEDRPSIPSWQAFIDKGDEPNPNPPPLHQPFVWTTIALLLAVLIVLAIVALLFFAPVGWNIKIIMAAVIGIAGAALIWFAGTLQGPFG